MCRPEVIMLDLYFLSSRHWRRQIFCIISKSFSFIIYTICFMKFLFYFLSIFHSDYVFIYRSTSVKQSIGDISLIEDSRVQSRMTPTKFSTSHVQGIQKLL